MSKLLDFITLPLSLPVSPIWDIVITAIIGEAVYRYAYYVAGEYGSSGRERFLIHWLVRFPAYFLVWGSACLIILICRFVRTHMWVLAIAGVIVVAAIAGIVYKTRKDRKNAERGTEKNEG